MKTHLFLLLLLLVPASASAQSKGDDEPDFMKEPIRATRRRGFLVGVNAAPALLISRSTPTEFAKRNDAFAVNLGPRVVPTVSGFVGAAFADELSVALEVQPSLVSTADVKVNGVAVVFRIEAWPLVSYGGVFRDLAVVARFGLGNASLSDRATGDALGGGSYSLVGGELMWDAFRWHGLGVGPTLGAAYRKGDTHEQTDVSAGLRVVFYGGP